MDLKTFISQSIKDIFDGVIEAQEYAKSKNGLVNVYQDVCHRNISYDIAVTISSEKELSGKGGASISVVSANFDGKIAREHSEISRITFTIPVILPNKEYVPKSPKREISMGAI